VQNLLIFRTHVFEGQDHLLAISGRKVDVAVIVRDTDLISGHLKIYQIECISSLRVTRMVETRIAPRYRVMKPAQIEYGGVKIPCTVRDLSITGAALEVSHPTGIPEKFTLVVPEDGLKLPCHVVRRTDFRIGVAFE
jgi:hypothetical protein